MAGPYIIQFREKCLPPYLCHVTFIILATKMRIASDWGIRVPTGKCEGCSLRVADGMFV